MQRKGGQEEKVVWAVYRGWEEYKKKFPYQVHFQRQMGWSEISKDKEVKEWMEWKEGSEDRLARWEVNYYNAANEALDEKVEKWLRRGGGQ